MGRRRVALSFHCLRHNTTSWLKKAGVPESVVRDIIGHESELVSRQYTHVDDATKRNAIRHLPTILGAAAANPSRPEADDISPRAARTFMRAALPVGVKPHVKKTLTPAPAPFQAVTSRLIRKVHDCA